MVRMEKSDLPDTVPLDTIQGVLDEHPVTLALLFGSHVTGTAHPASDIDIAVELDGLRPGDDGYNAAFFGLSADLSAALDTNDVDLVDIHTTRENLSKTVLDQGILLIGDPDRVTELRHRYRSQDAAGRSLRERLDNAVEAIDDHLA